MEVFLPFPGDGRAMVPPMTHVKGTWLGSSVLALRERGHVEAYRARLDPAYHDVLLHGSTGEWHPIDVLLAHYDACERLHLSTEEIVTLGEHVSKRAQGGVVELTARLAESAGVTPWVVMAQFNRLLARVARGGGLGVFKTGPKEARVEIVQFPGARFAYCQAAVPGILQSLLGPFCTRVYAAVIPTLVSPNQIVTKVSWA